MPLSRRELLARLAFGALFIPAVARAPRSVLGSLLFDPDAPVVPTKPVPVNPFLRDGKALVAIVHGDDPAAMLKAGLELLGGLDRLAVAGKRVLIKPNVVNRNPPPATTDPRVVRAVAASAKNAGAAEVTVADSSGIIRFPTSENLTVTGNRQAAESTGARVLALEDEPWVRVEPSKAKALPHYYLSKAVYEADIFINVPVVKTHRFAHYSCSLKNLVGITHPRYRPSVTFLSSDWHERIAELNLAVHPQLTIADATTIMIAGGPTSGTSAPGNMLILSGDRVALDVTALALVRSFGAWEKVEDRTVWEQRQIKRASELGLGVNGPAQVEILSGSVTAESPEFTRRVEAIRRDVAGT